MTPDLYPIYVRTGRGPTQYKAGFIDLAGRMVIDPDFEDAREFREGIATVKSNGKWGGIDLTGNLVVPCRSSAPLRFSEGRTTFLEGGLRGVLAADGTVVVRPRYRTISDFSDSAAYVRDANDLYGYIDLNGSEKVPPFFENASQFSGGLAPVKLGGKWGYIDIEARFAIEPTFDASHVFSDGLARVSDGGRWGYIEPSGQFFIPPKFAYALTFSEGLATAAIEDKENKGPYGYIGRSGDFVIRPSYVYTMPFAEGLTAVTLEEKAVFRFIDRNGDRAFPGEFLSVESFYHGLCLVSTMKTIAYIDRLGRTVWEGPYVSRM
jgi:hypothetical protein